MNEDLKLQIEQTELFLQTLKGTLELQPPREQKEGEKLISKFYSAIKEIIEFAEANSYNADIIPLCLSTATITIELKYREIFFKPQ